MKFYALATAAALCATPVASAYTVGFGSPLIVRRLNSARNPCRSPGACNSNDPFDALRSEFVDSPRRRRARRFAEKTGSQSLDRQREMIQQAFNLANEFMEEKGTTEEFIDRAFGAVNDVSSGRASPRYEVSNEEDAFLLAIDVPGIKSEDLDLSVNNDDRTLTISGKRTIGRGDNVRVTEFSKSFSLGDTAVLDDVSAKLGNGVLAVTVPKQPPKKAEDYVTKIPIVEAVEEEEESNEEDIEIMETTNEVDEESNAEEIEITETTNEVDEANEKADESS